MMVVKEEGRRVRVLGGDDGDCLSLGFPITSGFQKLDSTISFFVTSVECRFCLVRCKVSFRYCRPDTAKYLTN